jgi:thymidylate synthase
MKQYLDTLKLILDEGELIPNRTGISAITYPHISIRHDMSQGFPLLTTKKMAWKSLKVELEFFIKGLRDKKWLQDRGCHIWDEWCNPAKIPDNLQGDAKKEYQLQEMDLGAVYGYQWRQFNDNIENPKADQLKEVVAGLKSNPNNRQLICSAWNPLQIDEQALPPCHILWHVFVTNGKLHLCWFQRSCDWFLGVPFNLASYGLLLHLLAKETGYKEGILTGFFSNCHVYENHVDLARQQLERCPLNLPFVRTSRFDNIFDWTYEDTVLDNYQSHSKLVAEIAV